MADQEQWQPSIERGGVPLYLAIADAIEADIRAGRLATGTRLPAQRELAARLGIDFTTVTRGYAEARNRGLVTGRAGQGTFVSVAAGHPAMAEDDAWVDMGMNSPPRPAEPRLEAQLRQGLVELAQHFDMTSLQTYGASAGEEDDRRAGRQWLSRRLPDVALDRILITPGAQAGLLVVLLQVAQPGDLILTEALTYPGMKALCSQLGLRLQGLPMDEEGLDPDAFRAACRAERPKALYCTPTLHNPTTATMSAARRQAVVAVAREFGVTIIEDDAYGPLPREALPPLAALAPELTHLVAGLAKTVGPMLRLAYLVAPDAATAQRAVAVQRATTFMASPLTAALATRWIMPGTAARLLDAIRDEAAARQAIAAEMLPADSYRSRPEAFHLWLDLPRPWSTVEFLAHLSARRIRAVGSDSFAPQPPAAAGVRICLGNLKDRAQTRRALAGIAGLLRQEPIGALIV